MGKETYTGGVVTAQDRKALAPGEMQAMTGYFYKPGDRSGPHKLGGRSTFGDTGSAAKIKGVALLQYDSGGVDRLLAYSGTTFYSATPGDTGSPSALLTGLDPLGMNLAKVAFNDDWFIGNGYDRNKRVLSDGSIIQMGMYEPVQAPAVVASFGAPNLTRPASETNGSGSAAFTLPANARDSIISSFSYAYRTANGTSTCRWNFASLSTAAESSLTVRWGITGLPADNLDPSGGLGDDAEFDATLTVRYSLDSGATWSTLFAQIITGAKVPAETSIPVSVVAQTVHVDVTLEKRFGQPVTAKIYDIRIASGGINAAFTASPGFYYAITEYDAVNDEESPWVMHSEARIQLLGQNLVTMTLPSTANNTETTHFNIYRTVNGGSPPVDLKYIGQAVLGQTTWYDVFSYDKDTPGIRSLRLLKISVDPDEPGQYIPANSPPQPFDFMTTYGPFIIGLTPQFPRQLAYNLPSFPGWWPVYYVVSSFPLPENDQLMSAAEVGDSLVVGAKGAILVIDGLPEATGGIFQQASVRSMTGQPGCVGRLAMCSYSVSGEPRAAWVSPLGIHITNAQTAERISDDIAWGGTVNKATLSSSVLAWNEDISCLIFAYDSDGDGVNDRHWLIHMSPDFVNERGRPKWTGPHYGKIACLDSGYVSSEFKMYSGHGSDGKIYVENDDVGTDSSGAYSGTVHPAILRSRRMYGNHKDIDIDVLNLSHGDWGTGQTAEMAWTAGNDFSDTEETITKVVSLSGHKGEEIWIGRLAEWHEYVLTHLGSGRGTIVDMEAEAKAVGMTGRTQA